MRILYSQAESFLVFSEFALPSQSLVQDTELVIGREEVSYGKTSRLFERQFRLDLHT